MTVFFHYLANKIFFSSCCFRFTQEDINNGRVKYEPTAGVEIGQTSVFYSLKFTVSDDSNRRLPEQEFTIEVLPVDNKAPTIGSNIRLAVEKGNSILLSDEILQVQDVDTSKSDLQFSIERKPQFGNIVKLFQDFHTVLREGRGLGGMITEFSVITAMCYLLHVTVLAQRFSACIHFNHRGSKTRSILLL